MSNQYNFESQFEQKLLATLVRDVEFYLRNSHAIRYDYFTNPLRRDICEKTIDYVKEYGKAIPKDILRNELQNLFHERKIEHSTIDEYFEVIDELFAMDLSGEQYTEDQVIQFAQEQQMKKVLGDAVDRLEAHQDLNPILGDVSKALQVGNKIKPSILRTCDDVDETKGNEDEDWIVKGLIAKNDINLWYSPPGCGKSHLVWLIGNYTDYGKEWQGIEVHKTPVTYIDLENTEDVRRHFKRVVGTGKMRLITLEDDFDIPNVDTTPDKFEEFILTLPQGVIVIDTFAMVTAHTKFAEGKWEVDPIIKVLRRLCAKGYTFVLIFHSLKADPKTIKGPQELLGRVGHVVSIYSVPDAGETEETDELEDENPNKPKTLFVGTRADLKSRHKKYRYWLRADFNEGSPTKGFKRLSNPNDPILERIQFELLTYLEQKEFDPDHSNDYFPNQKEFIKLIIDAELVAGKDKERKARKYIKQGRKKFWTEEEVTYRNYRYRPAGL